MEMYPLRFEPIFKERLWGGEKLRTVLGKPATGSQIGESWEISGVPGDESVVAEGPYAGQRLTELIAAFPEALLGRRVLEQFGTEFPILVKFIDASQDLSIQLHPDDRLARARHGSFGKTEMWYIMDADPGARLIVGFERDVSRREYEKALAEGRLTELLHYLEAKPGDGIFIPAGKIHAIGAGVLLAEIQQSSDVTYRVYDFNRRDASGRLRELHTDLALDAMDFSRRDDFILGYRRDADQTCNMARTPYFTTNYLNLTRTFEADLGSRDAFTIFLCVSGGARVRLGPSQAELKTGETLLIPAAAGQVVLETKGCELLEVTL